MIDADWLVERLVAVLRWQVANPHAEPAAAPEVPPSGQRAWSIFLALHEARSGNGWGANPISFAEIDAWSRLTREPVRPWELQILRALDRAFLEAVGRRQDQPARDVSTRPMSGELFDAVFG